MSQLVSLPYGAFELKRCYQRNMTAGIFVVVAVSAAILSLWIGMTSQTGPTTTELTNPAEEHPTQVWQGPPISIIRPGPPGVGKAAEAQKQKAGARLVLAPDTSNIEESMIAPPGDDLGTVPGPSDGSMGGAIPGSGQSGCEETALPSPEDFVPYQTPPMPVNEIKPQYPRLALEGGFSAVVYMQIFVGSDGQVKKAQAVKCTRPGIGFEEAAQAAAYKSVYRPAIQSDHPVGVWIGYIVRFKIE